MEYILWIIVLLAVAVVVTVARIAVTRARSIREMEDHVNRMQERGQFN